MAKKANQIKIHLELTPEQQAQIRRALGKDVRALELTPELLEARIAPGRAGGIFGDFAT